MKKQILVVVIVGVMLYAAVALILSYKLEQSKNPLLESDVNSKNFARIYTFYVQSNPLSEGRFAQGTGHGVTALFVVDFISNESQQSYRALAPRLWQEFGENGTLSLGQKYYLTKDEYEHKTGRFIYAQAARCYQTLGGEDLISFTQTLFTTATDAVPQTLREAGIDPDTCPQDATLAEDMTETELYRIQAPSVYIGVAGTDNTVLYGTPSWTRVVRTVRDKQIQIGI